HTSTLRPVPPLRSADLHSANEKTSSEFGGATLKPTPQLRSADLHGANEKASNEFGGATLKPAPQLHSAEMHTANEVKSGRPAEQQPRAARRGFGVRTAAIQVSDARAVAAATSARFASQQARR